MSTKIISPLITAALLLPTAANASCTDMMSKWTDMFAAGRTLHGEYATCKAWPANPALTLVAMPFPRAQSTDDEGVDDLLLVVADSKTGAVIAHLMQPSAIAYDGLRLSGLTLDTARYQLTADKRAFGVRIEHVTGPSSPYAASALNLYVIEGKTVRPVLRQLVVSESRLERYSGCASQSSEMTRAISIGAADASGYAALQIAEQAGDTVMSGAGETCAEKAGPLRRTNYTLSYRAGKYLVPKALAYVQ